MKKINFESGDVHIFKESLSMLREHFSTTASCRPYDKETSELANEIVELAQVVDPKPSWSRSPPTESGWYWAVEPRRVPWKVEPLCFPGLMYVFCEKKKGVAHLTVASMPLLLDTHSLEEFVAKNPETWWMKVLTPKFDPNSPSTIR